MVTKEQFKNKMCLFCASDYHLEMILLPYIKERIDNSKFIIFTENNLEDSISTLLTKVNLDEKDKQKIKNINWKDTDDVKYEQMERDIDKNVRVIINGSFNYIKFVNKKIEEISNKEIEIIDCYHIGDKDVDILNIQKQYKKILNTQKIYNK